MRELNFTPEQRNRLEQLRLQQEKAQIQNRAAVETSHLDLRQLLRAEKPDRAAIEKKITEIGNLQAQQMKARTMAELDLRDLLTPEQREKLKQLREQRPVAPRPAQQPVPQTPPAQRQAPNRPPV